MQIPIPDYILAYASNTYRNYVPHMRVGGFGETQDQARGEGDFLDLIANLLIFDLLGKHGKVCSMDLTCGTGDKKDLSIRIKGKDLAWNIKTSKYAPFKDNLNLFVKEEEINKPIQGYIQCFVHMDENGQPPHVHIAGCCITSGPLWEKARDNIIVIPCTNHRGIGIKVNKLHDFRKLVKMADNKF